MNIKKNSNLKFVTANINEYNLSLKIVELLKLNII